MSLGGSDRLAQAGSHAGQCRDSGWSVGFMRRMTLVLQMGGSSLVSQTTPKGILRQ